LAVDGFEFVRGKNYFCQVRFLCRFKRNFLRRLCLLILALRRFLSEPMSQKITNLGPVAN